jgi:DNA polymerase III delta subunit
MATFAQWTRLHYEAGELKRAYYLAGPDRVLVEEVVDAIRERADPHELDYASLNTTENPTTAIWDAINQYPLDPTRRRLVIVRDCERIQKWTTLTSWLGSRLIPQVTAVFVDGRATVDTQREHIAAIAKTGRLVTCGPLNDDDAHAFLASKCAIDKSDCLRLLERVGGDIRLALDAARKAAALGARLDDRAVEALTAPSPSEQFEDALIRLDKAAAVAAAALVDPSDLSRTIGALDYRLEQVRKLAAAQRRQMTIADIIKNSKIPPFVIKRLLPVTKHYPRDATARRTAALATADSALRTGARDGVLELLTALW